MEQYFLKLIIAPLFNSQNACLTPMSITTKQTTYLVRHLKCPAILTCFIFVVLLVAVAKFWHLKQLHLFTQPACLVGLLDLLICLVCARYYHPCFVEVDFLETYVP
jgi:hypothetical protein